MAGTDLRSWIARIVLAAACAAPTSPAQAVIYISTFDPLGFFGVASFDVGSSCLSSDGLMPNDGAPCTVTWLDAEVTLVDAGGATLTYTYAAFLPSTGAVVSISVLLGDLAGVFSTLIGPVVIAGDPTPDFNGSFSLMFSGDVVSLVKDGLPVATAEAEFFRVPAPATLALTLLALGAGWLARKVAAIRSESR